LKEEEAHIWFERGIYKYNSHQAVYNMRAQSKHREKGVCTKHYNSHDAEPQAAPLQAETPAVCYDSALGIKITKRSTAQPTEAELQHDFSQSLLLLVLTSSSPLESRRHNRNKLDPPSSQTLDICHRNSLVRRSGY